MYEERPLWMLFICYDCTGAFRFICSPIVYLLNRHSGGEEYMTQKNCEKCGCCECDCHSRGDGGCLSIIIVFFCFVFLSRLDDILRIVKTL